MLSLCLYVNTTFSLFSFKLTSTGTLSSLTILLYKYIKGIPMKSSTTKTFMAFAYNFQISNLYLHKLLDEHAYKTIFIQHFHTNIIKGKNKF